RPHCVLCQALFKLADASEVLVELVAVAGADRRPHLARLRLDRVENAAAILKAAIRLLDFVRPSLDKELCEYARRPAFRRHRRTAAGPRQAEALARKRQTGVAGLAMQMLGSELIERDGVFEAGALLRMRSASQEAVVRVMARADVGVRQPRDDRKVV